MEVQEGQRTIVEYKLVYKFMNHLLSNLHEDTYDEDWMRPDEDAKYYVPLRDYVQSQLTYFITGSFYGTRRSETLIGCKNYMESFKLGDVYQVSNKNKGSFKTVFNWYISDLAHLMLKIIVDSKEQHYRELTPTLPSVMWIDRTRYELQFDWKEQALTEKEYHLLSSDTVTKFIQGCRNGSININDFLKRVIDNMSPDFQNIINVMDIYESIMEDKGRKSYLMGKAIVYMYVSIMELYSIIDEY